MSSNNSLLVIGDDLTGANDTGVMFADASYQTVLLRDLAVLDRADFSAAQVFAVSTNCRAKGEEGRELTAQAVMQAAVCGAGRIYLKIDSTMRGSVRYQIAGALQEWSKIHPDAKAVVCPAYPVMGRTIESGVLYVNGVPVNETPSGKDRICPVPTAVMTGLIPGSRALSSADADTLADKIKQAEEKVLIVDAKDMTDLKELGKAVEKLGPAVIPVGSAGLASCLHPGAPQGSADKTLPDLGRTLCLISSIHAVSQEQVETFLNTERGTGSTVFIPANNQLLNAQAQHGLQAQIKALAALPSKQLIILANPAALAASVDVASAATTIAQNMAALAKTALESSKFQSVIIFGGDGTNAFMKLENIEQLKLHFSASAGVPLTTIMTGPLKGTALLTKSGGFGKSDLLSHLLK